MSIYIEDLEKENKILLAFMIFFIVIAMIFNISYWVLRNEYTKIDKEKARLEQQVKDYTWQLEQVEYIIKCRGDK